VQPLVENRALDDDVQGQWDQLLLLVDTGLKDNVRLCGALMLHRNNLLYAALLHASFLIASPPAGRAEVIKAGWSLLCLYRNKYCSVSSVLLAVLVQKSKDSSGFVLSLFFKLFSEMII